MVSAEVGPGPVNLILTCAFWAMIGFALARVRWWAGLPSLLFLLITLIASFKRVSEPAIAALLRRAFGPHYLAYHVVATIVAAVVVLYGMRSRGLRAANTRRWA